MKLQSKPFVALASGAVMLLGMLGGQEAQAQNILDPSHSGTAVLASSIPADDLTVTYQVYYDPTAQDYTYDYSFINTTTTALVSQLQLSFDPSDPGTILPGSLSANGSPAANVALDFNFSPKLSPGQSSGTLTFMSDWAPMMGNAGATGLGTGSPWAASPNGTELAIPNIGVIPEPATTSLLAFGLLAPIFRKKTLFKKT